VDIKIMPQELLDLWGTDAALSLTSLLLNLVIGAGMSLILRWHFLRFGSTLSNRQEFAQVFPFVLLTTVLIITIVKSSLALSLGLVGALSIVRFRTPIKEPEELAYLFISIAMGLGLGANQTIPTVIAGLAILVMVALLNLRRRETHGKNLFLSVDWSSANDQHPDRYLERVSEVIAKHVVQCDLRRFDIREGSIDATFFLDVASLDNLSAMTDELQRTFDNVGVTFLDQNQMPSI
jgi:hypothetical protein